MSKAIPVLKREQKQTKLNKLSFKSKCYETQSQSASFTQKSGNNVLAFHCVWALWVSKGVFIVRL